MNRLKCIVPAGSKISPFSNALAEEANPSDGTTQMYRSGLTTLFTAPEYIDLKTFVVERLNCIGSTQNGLKGGGISSMKGRKCIVPAGSMYSPPFQNTLALI